MTNRILDVSLHDVSLIPAEAEVLVRVRPEHLQPGVEVRGRLMGPRCRFAGTVEVAYHLRRTAAEAEVLTLRAIIPEASLWEPETPHLYTGLVELWQDGVQCDRTQVRHGLRDVRLSAAGLRVNGRPLVLRGKRVAACTEEETMAWRQEGYNLLLAPVRPESRHVWETADQMGFFVLGEVDGPAAAALAHGLAGCASTLGWLLEGETTGLPPAPLRGSRMPGSDFALATPAEAARMEAGAAVLLLGEDPGPEGVVVLGRVTSDDGGKG